jgi:hypothetical protein
MIYLTQAQRQQHSWSHNVSCGQASRKIVAPGHGLARPASAPKSPATQSLQWEISRCLQPVSCTSTLTSWGLSQHRQATGTASLRSTVSRVGQKQSQYRTSQQHITRPRCRLDIPFRLPADYHHGPGTSIRVAPLPLPGQNVWNPALQDNRPSPSSQWSGGTFPPDVEGSHHVPRRPAVDRGTPTGSPGNPHFIQGRSKSVSS